MVIDRKIRQLYNVLVATGEKGMTSLKLSHKILKKARYLS